MNLHGRKPVEVHSKSKCLIVKQVRPESFLCGAAKFFQKELDKSLRMVGRTHFIDRYMLLVANKKHMGLCISGYGTRKR